MHLSRQPERSIAEYGDFAKQGEAISNRLHLLKNEFGFLSPNGWINTPAFLYIHHEDLVEEDIGLKDDEPGPNPLDDTRVHPDDYEIAQELCENMEGIDPEDAQTLNPSTWTVRFMTNDLETRLEHMAGLALSAFDENVRGRAGGEYKTYLIRMCARELMNPFKDDRPPFCLPSAMDVMTMLTGETAETLANGRVATAYVTGLRRDRAFIRLESMITGEIPFQRIAESGQELQNIDDFVRKGQTVRGAIYEVKPEELWVGMSLLQADVGLAIQTTQGARRDPQFDTDAETRDRVEYERRKRQEAGPIARIVNHPSWRVMDRRSAEKYLSDQNRGDAVIRPSSKGTDHLAVTWKVDDGVYQHIGKSEFC